jgi:tRNA(fMet)-specific endonuclease VapC
VAMKIAIDSNRYTDLCRGVPEVVEIVESALEIYVPLIVVAEQRAGFAHGTARQKNERVLTKFLNSPGVSVLAPDEQTTFFYADLYAYLRKRGRPIPTNDLWIAALVVQHSLVLYDRDRDFDALPQLARLSH